MAITWETADALMLRGLGRMWGEGMAIVCETSSVLVLGRTIVRETSSTLVLRNVIIMGVASVGIDCGISIALILSSLAAMRVERRRLE